MIESLTDPNVVAGEWVLAMYYDEHHKRMSWREFLHEMQSRGFSDINAARAIDLLQYAGYISTTDHGFLLNAKRRTSRG